MADDTTTAPAPVTYDPDQIAAMLQRLQLQPPTQAPMSTADGPGAHGFAGFIGDVGNVLGGGGSGLLGLGPDEEAAAGRRALMAAGINMLISGGPSYEPKNFGTTLGHGLEAAMGSRAESENRAFYGRGAQQQLAQQAFQNRLSAIKEALPLLTLQYNQQLADAQRRSALAATGGGKGSITGAIDPVAAMPREKALDALAERESGNQNVPNAEGGDASGYWQIRDATWRDGAKLAGVDITKYPRAMDAPRDVQRQVAGAIYDRDGAKPWAASAPGRPAQTASATPPAASTAPPGVQVGGDAPSPPGGSTAAAEPYTGGGIGAALQPPKGAPVYTGGEPQPPAKGTPVPAGKLLPKTADNVGAIVAGMQAARTGPQPRTALTAGPGAPTQTATATPNAPEAGWGSKIPSAYSDSPTVKAPAAAPAATTTAPAVVTPPAPKPIDPANPPPFVYQKGPDPVGEPYDYALRPEQKAKFDAEQADINRQIKVTADPAALAELQKQRRDLDKQQADALAARRKEVDDAKAKYHDADRAQQVDLYKTNIANAQGVRLKQLENENAIAQSDNATKNTVRQKIAEPILAKADAAEAMLRNAQNLELFARQQGPANALWGTDFGRNATNWIVGLGGNSAWAKEAAARQSWDTLVNGMFNDVHVPGMGAQSDRETGFLMSQWGSSAQTPLDRMTQLAIIRKNAEARIQDGIDVNKLVETNKPISDIHDIRKTRQIFDRPPPEAQNDAGARSTYNGSHPMGEPYVTWAPKAGGGAPVMKWARNTGDPQHPVELMPNVDVRP